MVQARLCLFLLLPRVASASPSQRNQPFMPRITSTAIKSSLQSRRGFRSPLRRSGIHAAPRATLAHALGSGDTAARGTAASARAQSTSPRSTENDSAADPLDIFPYADAENCSSSILAPLPHRQTATAARDFARPCCLCRPIAMSIESVSSWEEDAETSSVSEAEGGCHASARPKPAQAPMMRHSMCGERSPRRPAAQPTGSRDGGEGNITQVSALHRLNARLTRARRRNRGHASSSCSDAAANLSQQSAGVSDRSRRRVRPQQPPSQLAPEFVASDSVIDLLSEDWPSKAWLK